MATEKLIPLSEVKKKITAVRQYFSGYPSTEQDKLARSVAKLCMEEVGKIKPVDAVEVVHGRWIYEEEPDKDNNVQANCSVCFAGDLHATDMMNKVPYCWKCGAKMDGKENRQCVRFYSGGRPGERVRRFGWTEARWIATGWKVMACAWAREISL